MKGLAFVQPKLYSLQSRPRPIGLDFECPPSQSIQGRTGAGHFLGGNLSVPVRIERHQGFQVGARQCERYRKMLALKTRFHGAQPGIVPLRQGRHAKSNQQKQSKDLS